MERIKFPSWYCSSKKFYLSVQSILQAIQVLQCKTKGVGKIIKTTNKEG